MTKNNENSTRNFKRDSKKVHSSNAKSDSKKVHSSISLSLMIFLDKFLFLLENMFFEALFKNILYLRDNTNSLENPCKVVNITYNDTT